MQALRAFWAKSFLNKLVILVLAPLLCCCAYVAVAQPGRNANVQGPQPTAASAAEGATELPQPTEAPTATPAPTEPPPTVAPTAEPTGLGIRPDDLRRTFSGLGFQFRDSPAVDGVPRQIGSGPNSTSLELIGGDDGLQKATLLTGVPRGDQEGQSRVGEYIGLVINAVAPEHQQEIANWVVDQLRATSAGEDVTGRTLETGEFISSVTTIPASDGIALTYSIEPLP